MEKRGWKSLSERKFEQEVDKVQNWKLKGIKYLKLAKGELVKGPFINDENYFMDSWDKYAPESTFVGFGNTIVTAVRDVKNQIKKRVGNRKGFSLVLRFAVVEPFRKAKEPNIRGFVCTIQGVLVKNPEIVFKS